MAEEFDGGDGIEGGDTGATPAPEGQPGGVDARLDAHYDLQRSDPKRYRSDETQREIAALEGEKVGAPPSTDEPLDGEDDGPKDIGVPHDADGYTVPEIEGHTWDDRQRGEIGDFLQDAHAAGFTQAQIDLALSALARSNLKLAEASSSSSSSDGRAQETAKTTEEALRKQWGRSYRQNRTLANQEAMAIWGDHAPDVANIRLADGSFLGDNRWFVDGLHKLVGRQAGPAENQSSEDRLNYLYSLQTKNTKNTRPRKCKMKSSPS
jgi:hypothetical protein